MVKKIFFFSSCALLLLATLAFFSVIFLYKNLPTVEQITNRQVSQSTKIFDRSGTILLYEITNGQTRTVVPIANIPKYLLDATISVEDEKFYEEPAFDWRAIVRAILVNLRLREGYVGQGASTITQQLARNAFLTPEKTISRKAKELLLAIRLNRIYSKDQILELYLNQIPYGPILYGIEAASNGYFNKSAKDLNLAESALLAALPKAPTYYSPWGSHMKDLIGRQHFILDKMLKNGKISQKELESAKKYKLVFAPQRRGIKAPHFVMAVQDYLLQKYGEALVRQGGLRVITTLNWDLQQIAEKVVAAGAEENEKLYGGKNAALVAEDPKSGQILALVGSRDYFDIKNEGNFSVATQGLRQPGSALKPFVYLTAFKKGYAPDTVVFDAPTEFAANNPLCPAIPDFRNDSRQCFHPENFDDKFRGPIKLRQALAQSVNIPAVKVLYLAGLKDSVKTAYDFGLTTLTSPDLYGLSLVLGGGAVKLVDLVAAYSVLAQDGIKHDQSLVLEVKGAHGKTLESWRDQASQVSDSEPVRLVNNILSDTQARSGLFESSLGLTVFPDHDVALKTGTSNDYRDAWALGYTPSLVAGVWAGNNDNSPMQKHGSSILAAIPIWHSFMAEAIKNLPAETFNRPDPPAPAKPILAGDYAHNKQIHSILYYLDKNNPAGPPPSNPAGDPQFGNWETGVLAWAERNLPDFINYNQPVVPGMESGVAVPTSTPAATPPQVTINDPAPGTFVGGQINIFASVAGTAISKIKVYWNGAPISEFVLDPPVANYDFRWLLSPQSIASQNLLEIEALGQAGTNRASTIVYGAK